MPLSKCGRRNGNNIPILNSLFQTILKLPRYQELLFMIDTCQANTMYSKLYSPNIIATGSSEIDQSSYSHHADNDVGVAVIDRYTYYNLDFLETNVREPSSKKTLGDLFDSYDDEKIHSHAGVRYDLFPGGEEVARERLLMDFFGNVQNVEVDGVGARNETEWKDDLLQLGRKISSIREDEERATNRTRGEEREQRNRTSSETKMAMSARQGRMGAAKVEVETGWWGKKAAGALAIAGCTMVWVAGTYLESSR
jgi:phosphatidylinositol glycan class K